MNKPRLFLVEKPLTRLQALLEQRQAIDDAIYALQQYKFLRKAYETLGEPELDQEPGKKQMTN